MSKKTSVYIILAFSLCIAGYFLTSTFEAKKSVQKEIIYACKTASEVYMAWGINYLLIPPKKYWPVNSFEKEGLVYTKMNKRNDTFFVTVTLPNNTLLNYWTVQKKDTSGNEINVWDTGTPNQQYLNVGFYYYHYSFSGLFIFLAGFIPLLIYYLRNLEKKLVLQPSTIFKIKGYVPQLDSIRAIAVLLVIVYHWSGENKLINFIPNGPLGVNIFFVLSGFLITGILLKARNQLAGNQIKRSTVFKNFYIRRTLRIFPIYYLLLIILWFLHDPSILGDGIYYFTYTSNYLFFWKEFFPARLAHLWSLAVEEQFYIFWPWLMILISRKLLPYLILFFLVIGISTNYIYTEKSWWVTIFTPACFDAFATGAFLSYLTVYRQDIILLLQPKFKWICIAIMSLFVLGFFGVSLLPGRTVHALIAASIIYYCLFKRNNKIINLILDNKWLIRIGKISYGVYLYHLFIPELWGLIISKFASHNIDFFYNSAMVVSLKPLWLFIQEFSFLMLLCILSWKLIEKPINTLKKKFENEPVFST